MIERYSRADMSEVFSDQSRIDLWLRVEQQVLRTLADEGAAPAEAAAALEAVARVHVVDVARREREIHHDLAAFVDVLAAQAPGAAGWVHFGLTSSDVVDTALALQLDAAGGLVLQGVRALRDRVLERAHEHRDTVMLGRTHGMPAEPITFGAKLAGWWHQLGRDEERIERALRETAVGKLSGAVGLYSGVGPEVERRVLEALGLRVEAGATQVVQRDRHAGVVCALAILASTLERIGTEVRHLQRAEVAEVSEPFAAGQKGSSAMPHKRNPIVAERLCGLARVVRSHAEVALQDIALWHERDISHSSAERVVLPDAFLLVDYMLDRAAWLVSGLVVDPRRMLDNVGAQRGLVASQAVLLALVRAGLDRDDAYRAVQDAAAAVHEGSEPDLPAALARHPEAGARLDAQDVRELCDPERVPAGVAAIFDRLPAATAD